MRIISRKMISVYWEGEPQSEDALKSWYAEAKSATWLSPVDVKEKYGKASILKDGRVVFDISANNYRLVTWINYEFHTIYIRFIGTHKQYDEIDAQTI